MKRSLGMKCKRILAGFMAFTMASVLAAGDAGAAFAAGCEELFFREGSAWIDGELYSRATASNARLANRQEDGVLIAVMSDESDYRAGGEVYLDVHIKNESDQEIKNGRLTWKGGGIEEGSAGFELCGETEEVRVSGTEDEEGAQPATGSDAALEGGTPPTATQTDAVQAEEQENGLSAHIENISLAPGEIYSARFLFTVSEEIERSRNQTLKFKFRGEQEGKSISAQESFLYAVNSLNVDAVEFADGNRVRTGEKAVLGIRSSLFDFDTGIVDTGVDLDELEELKKASESDAIKDAEDTDGELDAAENADGEPGRATESDAEPEASDEEDWKKASPSVAGRAQSALGQKEAVKQSGGQAEDKNDEEEKKEEAEDKERKEKEAEEREREEKEKEKKEREEAEEKEEEAKEGDGEELDLAKTTYEIEMFNARLNNFQARKALVEDANENMLLCSFRVSRDTEPGVYFGKITQKSRYRGKTYKSTQGFSIIVEGEGQICLEQSFGSARIAVSGPASSFPDADRLSITVEEPEEEAGGLIRQALEKKNEEGTGIRRFKALDIKLYADGREVEPEGPVSVSFKNLELEDVLGETGAGGEEKASASRMAAPAATQTAENAKEPDGERALGVFHLDESSVSVDEMLSTVEENGDIVMETDHFSIYIVVDMEQLGGEIALTVQHWAKITSLEGASGKDGLIISGKPDKKPGNATAKLKTATKFSQIYSDDKIMLDNKLEKSAEDLSKVCLASANKTIPNYKLSALWVLKEGKSASSTNEKDWTVYQASGSETITLKDNAVIRMVYTPVSASSTMEHTVTFFDYNVTDGKRYNKSGKQSSSGMYIKTKDQGINSKKNYTDGTNSNRLAVGMTTSGINHSNGNAKNKKGKLINRGNGNADAAVTDMVKGIGKDGPVYDGIYDAGLFNTKSKTGKKVIDNYKLVFDQVGDTYTLSSVKNGNGKSVLSGLGQFKEIYDNGSRQIFSNNFWPLDKESYSGRDPLFGKSGDKWYSDNKPMSWSSDDGKAHNWFFGMRYDFEFTVGDYTGPLNFYFRGDDDFWLFVDGKLRVDIGGIHSSVGSYVSFEDLKEDKDKVHKATIIYAERGAFGSSCYIQFTLPNVKPADFDTEVEKTEVIVTKKWEDHDNPYRPANIQVTLHYREKGEKEWKKYETVTMNGNENVWTHRWTDLPKEGYEYKVTEDTELEGYESQYSSEDGVCTQNSEGQWEIVITNTLHPETNVLAEKVWDDGNDQDGNRPDEVQMQLLYREKESGGSWKVFPGDTGILRLDGEADEGVSLEGAKSGEYEAWKGIYRGLPVFIKNSSGEEIEVEYLVRELNGTAALPEGGSLPGKRTGSEWNYTVSYTENPIPPENQGNSDELRIEADITVTNRYTPKTTEVSVEKKWEDASGIGGGKAQVGLYIRKSGELTLAERAQGDNPWTLESPDKLTYVWKNLPRYSGGEEIEYLVYERDAQGNPVTESGSGAVLEDGYRYEVSFSKEQNKTTITNKIKTAVLQVKKIINGEGELPNEPIDPDYKFLIHIREEGGSSDYASVLLGHGETSGEILLTPPDSGETFSVSETVPMEYSLKKMTVSENGAEAESSAGSVTVKPGRRYLVTVFNEPSHSGYFHRTASVTNVKDFADGQGGSFEPENPYGEEPLAPKDREKTFDTSQIAAIVGTEEKAGGRQKEKKGGGGDE